MSLLGEITKGKKIKPINVLLHGVHGIGKSTFGAGAKEPIFIGSEENDELDAARFPKITDWSMLEKQLSALLNESHDYKTVVIDTIDSLEQVAQKAILSGKDKDKTMATAMGGFGKAYEKMKDMFLNIRDTYLIPLREGRGMNIIILAHSEKVKHEDPITNTQYDHYQTAIHKKIKPIFEDWVSAILFANFELFRAERQSDGKEYAVGDGERRIFTEERPSHIAKNRFGLEYEMGLDYKEFAKEVIKYYGSAKKTELVCDTAKQTVTERPVSINDDVKEIKYQIESIMAELSEELLAKVEPAFKRAGDDLAKLKNVKKRLEKTLS